MECADWFVPGHVTIAAVQCITGLWSPESLTQVTCDSSNRRYHPLYVLHIFLVVRQKDYAKTFKLTKFYCLMRKQSILSNKKKVDC